VLTLLGAGLWVRANIVAVGRIRNVLPQANRRYLMYEVARASLIIQGTVVNANTSVWASAHQIEVAYPQGWTVAHVRPTTVFKGHCGTNVIVTPAGWWPGFVRGNSFIQPFTNGQEFIFFLDRNWSLSRWCYAKVFSHDELNLIPLTTEDRTTKSTVPTGAHERAPAVP
jgi:hypothetical protein